MIREFHVADFFTLANAACGVAAVLCAMKYLGNQSLVYFYVAAGLAPAAFVFDVLDGRIARSRQEHSTFGRELDSLADVISFRGRAGARICRGIAGGMGLGGVALLRLLRRESPRALQRDRGSTFDGRGQGCVFRRHAHSHQRAACRRACLCRLAGPVGRESLRRHMVDRAVGLHPLALLFVLSGTLMISKTLRIPKL
jgi:CDP-diacylglycerol--serine O-phosphatidyltransferase